MATTNAGRQTPPRQVGGPAETPITPKHVRIMRENRLRAKARIQQQAVAQNPASRLSVLGKRPHGPITLERGETAGKKTMIGPNGNITTITPSTTRNANLELQDTQIAPSKSRASSMAATAAAILDDPNAPLPRDKSLGNYIEFDLSKLQNSKGGFLVDEDEGKDAINKPLEQLRAERERIQARLREGQEPGINLVDTNVCKECNSREVDDQFRAVFNVLVCKACQNRNPEKYSLLTKTEVKEDYLLTDSELRDAELLPHLLKANPHKSTYSNMMLYLRCQVEEYAFSETRWGSEEGLDAEFARRDQEKAKRRESKFIKGLRDLRKKTRDNVWEKRQSAKHVCQFEDVEEEEEEEGEGSSGKQRCKECGFEIEVEVY